MERLLSRWKAALQILLLALVMATPGTVQAALAECPHSEATLTKITPAKITQGASSAVDCHEAMTAAPQPKDHSDQDSNGSSPTGCDMGMYCASTIALPVSFDDPAYFAVASAPAAIPAANFRSYNPTPDYPPPRI